MESSSSSAFSRKYSISLDQENSISLWSQCTWKSYNLLLPAWINSSQGRGCHSDPSSPLPSVTSIFLFNGRDFMSCCIIFPHCFFCRPRLLHPLTPAFIILFIQFSYSLLITWRYHLNLASHILSVMHATSRVFQVTSFLFLSFSETTNIIASPLMFLNSNYQVWYPPAAPED